MIRSQDLLRAIGQLLPFLCGLLAMVLMSQGRISYISC